MKRRLFTLMLAVAVLVTAFVPQLALPPKAQASGGTGEKLHYYLTPNNFTTFGSWTLTGTFVTGRTSPNPGEGEAPEGEPAIVKVNIQSGGQYKLWVRDRDYATNQPGTRSFHVGVDGVRLEKKFGTHGQEGFRWTEAGTFSLEAGVHELALHDTSAFFARCEGFFLTKDLGLVPPEDKNQLLALTPPEDSFSFLPSAGFPEWATEDATAAETATIENGRVKVVFYKGEGQQGPLVQNEIYVKDGEAWTKVKAKTEQLGFLLMTAANSRLAGQEEQFAQLQQEVAVDGGGTVSAIVTDFFRTGIPVWFIPSGFEKISEDRVDLHFDNPQAELTVRFEFDELSYEPKVTLEAQFPEKGAYSFMFFNGNETPYNDYETVTAPLLYVKKTVPSAPTVIPESYLFTPMATLHYAAGNARFAGKEMTSGIVMDPSSVPQDYAYPETSSFGLVLRGPKGDVRPQFTAPMFGTAHSLFEAGDHYTVSYRIINEAGSWYDTFKHVAQDLFNAKDVRTNYFHSLNEAIYNATDLMMDDDYGGWDPANMAFYNMEEQDLTTQSNSMSALQRYLLTEDKDILEKRAIPTLAYLLGRQKYHFKITGEGTSTYAGALPSQVGGPVSNYSSHIYGGLYEMTQGRMPYLLDHALQSPSSGANLTGVADQAAMYKFTGDEANLANLRAQADQYLATNPGTKRESRFVSGFIYGDYIPMVATLLNAYEATGESRYLEGAKESAELLLTGLWTTGYHDNYAETDYTVTQEKSGTRPLNANKYNFWWHGEQQWRLGNVDGEAKSAQELGVPLEEETAPGWLGGRVGMGTEHPVTPGHGNVITMNNWAGMLSKLSVYTGDPFFYTMARNAMIGRFGNYPGYYQDRIIFHQMKENYPYTGPDFTSIYWHHIPVFISMLEDFLINSAWVKSEGHVSFPSLFQSGYAYFASNQFGFAPGSFYGEEDMWLWLDRGIIQPDSVEIDYVAARKDGVLGLALMNEGSQDLASTIRLGEKVDPSRQYSGLATVYEADGSTSTVQVSNGEFDIVIPAKGIRSVVLHGISAVHTPAFANADYQYSNFTDTTLVEHIRGEGHVIQVTPDSYYAYVYSEDMNDTVSKMTINYSIGEETFTAEKSGYPYEFLIKVEDASKLFSYQLIATKIGGQTEQLGGGELKPYDFSKPGIVTKTEEQGRTAAFHTWGVYSSTDNGLLQVSVPSEDFLPLLPADNNLQGVKVTGLLTNSANGSIRTLNSVIAASKPDSSTRRVTLSIKPTSGVPLADYSGWDFSLWVKVPENLAVTYGRIAVPVNTTGMNVDRNEIRWVVPLSVFPFPVTDNKLNGLRIYGTLTNKTDQSTLQLDSVIRRHEPRGTAGVETVLVVEPTAAVPLNDYKNYTFSIGVDAPKGWKTPPFAAPFDATVRTTGTVGTNLKVVVEPNDLLLPLPFTFTKDSLNGYRIAGEFKNSTGAIIHKLDSVILSSAVRSDGGIDLVVPPTSRIPLQANYVRTQVTIYPQVPGLWNQDALWDGDFLYKVNPAGNGVTITGYAGRGEVSIPEQLAGLPVTAIGESAFQNKELTAVSIPETVTSIGASAFRDNALTRVVLPPQAAFIGNAAFRLNSLTEFIVGGADTAFGNGVLAYNPAEMTVYGYDGSTAQAYAGGNSHSFAIIAPPAISLQPDGNESWSQTAATQVTVSSAGASRPAGVWTQSEETPDGTADWEPIQPDGAVDKSGGSGPWYLHVQAEDMAGQPVYAHSRPFLLDNTGPVLEVGMETEDGLLYVPGSWTSQSVTASVYGTDLHSGLAALLVSRDNGASWADITASQQVTLEEEGIAALRFKAVDQAGNETTIDHAVKISRSGLQLTAALAKSDGSGYTGGTWSNLPVTADVYAANIQGPAVISLMHSSDHGASWQPYAAPLVYSGDGEYSLWVRAEDELQHMLTEQTVIRIDRTAPTVTLAPLGNPAATRQDSVTVAVYDAGAGVAADSLFYIWSSAALAPEYSAAWLAFISGGEISVPQNYGDWYLHLRARDQAGNETELASSVFRLTPPEDSGGEGNNDDSGDEAGGTGEAGRPGQAPGGSGTEASANSKPSPAGTPAGEGSPPLAQAASFRDIAGHWSEPIVREMATLEIITGYPDGSLQPDRSMTRAEFIAVVVRAMKAEAASDYVFPDTAGHWAEPLIAAAYAMGWTGGLTEDRFGPDEAITREQMLVILIRALKLSGQTGAATGFTDADSISQWASSAIALAVERGITDGYPDGSIRPGQSATRAEALTVLARAIALINK
ncbi:S-layer homology domain-containing protein [Paenibacillus sp. YN15]|uniref:S-layer homology domain-containing protein n=1 Tax=Paenibacillus sp. YN15 TaxID=1742774 RepID=UPI000DCC7F53|nr:S-layer homology domain-containing protein [Paenibacillus sp. YN15]RAV03032.1 hypothetical protein DQG13_08140 [Paenibacillus sp. YN15]